MDTAQILPVIIADREAKNAGISLQDLDSYTKIQLFMKDFTGNNRMLSQVMSARRGVERTTLERDLGNQSSRLSQLTREKNGFHSRLISEIPQIGIIITDLIEWVLTEQEVGELKPKLRRLLRDEEYAKQTLIHLLLWLGPKGS